MRRRAGAAAEPGVYATQARVELILEIAEREVRDRDFADARDHDESLAGDIEGECPLCVARNEEDEPVARSESIGCVDRASEVRVELRRLIGEDVESENRLPSVDRHR